jgi:2-phosphosulfolactate phosphatase
VPVKLDLLLTPPRQPLPSGEEDGLRDARVAVIDVLRSTTSMCHAMAAGCRRIMAAGDLGEVTELVESLGRSRVLLGGERESRPIPGFDLGNSPREFTSPRLKGTNLIMLTGNGTPALAALRHVRSVAVASLVNLGAAARWLAGAERHVLVVCSGQAGRFCLEDAVCGGMLIARVLELLPEQDVELNDAARVGLVLAERWGGDPRDCLDQSAHGQRLKAMGLGEDLDACASVDALDVLPFQWGEEITLTPPQVEDPEELSPVDATSGGQEESRER